MRVLIVDGHGLFREALISLLEQEEGFQVVDQAGSIREAVEKIVAGQPDVLLLDDLLPDGDGIESIPTLLKLSPETKIVILTILEDKQLHLKAIQSGAAGCLTKNISYSHLLDSLKALEICEAGNRISRTPVEFSQENHSGNGKNDSDLRFLTHREREVLDQLGTWATNQEIADRLGVSPNTIRAYVSRIVLKLHLSNRLEAAQFASHDTYQQNKGKFGD